MLLLGVFLLRPASGPKPASLLNQILLKLEQAGEYEIVIEEVAPGYTLQFEGTVGEGATLTGSLPIYELEVQQADGRLYVREPGTEQWEEEPELKSLAGFLVSPEVLLRSQRANFSRAEAGQEIYLDGMPYSMVYMELTGETDLIKALFPQIDTASIVAVNLGVAFEESSFTVKQIRLLVQFSNAGNLERAYYMQ